MLLLCQALQWYHTLFIFPQLISDSTSCLVGWQAMPSISSLWPRSLWSSFKFDFWEKSLYMLLTPQTNIDYMHVHNLKIDFYTIPYNYSRYNYINFRRKTIFAEFNQQKLRTFILSKYTYYYGIIHVRDRFWMRNSNSRENRGFHLRLSTFHAATNKNTAPTLLSHNTHAPTFHTLTIPSIPPVTNLDPSWLKHTTFWYDSFSPKSLRTEPTVFTNSLPLVDNSTILEVFPPEAGPFRYSMKIETFI